MPTPIPTPVPNPPTITQETAIKGSLELTLSISKTSYKVGEPVNAIFVITNSGNQTLDLNIGPVCYFLQMYNGNGTQIYDNHHEPLPMHLTDTELSAGANVTETIVWTQVNDINPLYLTQVSSGIYFIAGTLKITTVDFSQSYIIQTEPLEIVIVGS